MTKVEFINAFMQKAECSKKDAEVYVNAFMETIIDGLKAENIVQLTGFGSFKMRLVEAREGHNPQKPDEKITIPASNRVTFTPGKALKDSVNSKKKTVKKTETTTTKKVTKKVAKKK
jgi:DNA-binding protein HU-beta